MIERCEGDAAKERAASADGWISWFSILTRSFELALAHAEAALRGGSKENWVRANKAHSLLFLGRVDDARALYFDASGVSDWSRWTSDLENDFVKFESAGLSVPAMDAIRRQLNIREQ